MAGKAYSTLYRCPVSLTEAGSDFFWLCELTKPAKECILSWNAQRPAIGFLQFFLRLKNDAGWSPWHSWAEWGSKAGQPWQKGYKPQRFDSYALHEDLIIGQGITAVEVKVEGQEGASAAQLKQLYLSCLEAFEEHPKMSPPNSSIALPLSGYSQKLIAHARNRHLCSPASLYAVLCYFQPKQKAILSLVAGVHDQENDIYGNWPLNVAEGYSALHGTFNLCVHRLSDFHSLHNQLQIGMPVIVSVKGELQGAPKVYADGHLMVVRGYDAQSNTVLCLDPCAENHENTPIAYPYGDFMHAWAARKHLCYLIEAIPNVRSSSNKRQIRALREKKLSNMTYYKVANRVLIMQLLLISMPFLYAGCAP